MERMKREIPKHCNSLDRISALEEENKRLEEENKKLKEDNRFLTKISKEYMKKENIIEITEFTELYKDDLEKENQKLREELEKLKDIQSWEVVCLWWFGV